MSSQYHSDKSLKITRSSDSSPLEKVYSVEIAMHSLTISQSEFEVLLIAIAERLAKLGNGMRDPNATHAFGYLKMWDSGSTHRPIVFIDGGVDLRDPTGRDAAIEEFLQQANRELSACKERLSEPLPLISIQMDFKVRRSIFDLR